MDERQFVAPASAVPIIAKARTRFDRHRHKRSGCTLGSSSNSSSSSGPGAEYSAATDVTGDTILQQAETTYDAAGNVTWTVTRQRRHDATGTGQLTTMSGSQPQARVSFVGAWFDAVGRQTAVADYGTYNDGTPTRPNSAPARSDTILVSSTAYDSTGQAYKTTDPAAREDRREFDDAGRVIKIIDNYQDGTISASYPDEDVTVETAYTADGQIETLTAKIPTTDDQVTTYVYGTTLTDSEIARSDLLRATIYPDSDDTSAPLGDGSDSVYDRVGSGRI